MTKNREIQSIEKKYMYMYICRSCHGNLCDLIKDKLLCKEFYLVKDITIFLNTCIK